MITTADIRSRIGDLYALDALLRSSDPEEREMSVEYLDARHKVWNSDCASIWGRDAHEAALQVMADALNLHIAQWIADAFRVLLGEAPKHAAPATVYQIAKMFDLRYPRPGTRIVQSAIGGRETVYHLSDGAEYQHGRAGGR